MSKWSSFAVIFHIGVANPSNPKSYVGGVGRVINVESAIVFTAQVSP